MSEIGVHSERVLRAHHARPVRSRATPQARSEICIEAQVQDDLCLLQCGLVPGGTGVQNRDARMASHRLCHREQGDGGF